MKIQCPCGTKYAFNVTPEIAQSPVQFVCQSCGVDLSDPLNELIRQEVGVETQAAFVSPSTSQAIAPPPPGAARVPATITATAPAMAASVAPQTPPPAPTIRVKSRTASVPTEGEAASAVPAV